MPAGGWYLLKSNGVLSLSCPRNSPMLWLWVKMMECVLAPTVFISSGRIFQTERAELSCCSWWVPLSGTKGCKLRKTRPFCVDEVHTKWNQLPSPWVWCMVTWGPDYRVLVNRAGKCSGRYSFVCKEAVCTAQLGWRVVSETQSGQVLSVHLEFPFSVVGMRNGCIHFNQIHLGLTLPGRPQRWERTMQMGKPSLKKTEQKAQNLKMLFLQP